MKRDWFICTLERMAALCEKAYEQDYDSSDQTVKGTPELNAEYQRFLGRLRVESPEEVRRVIGLINAAATIFQSMGDPSTMAAGLMRVGLEGNMSVDDLP